MIYWVIQSQPIVSAFCNSELSNSQMNLTRMRKLWVPYWKNPANPVYRRLNTKLDANSNNQTWSYAKERSLNSILAQDYNEILFNKFTIRSRALKFSQIERCIFLVHSARLSTTPAQP